MNFLKRIGSSIWVALGAFAVAWAAVAATQRKAQAEKWQERAAEEQAKDVADAVERANQAMSQAKLHKAEAKRIADKAEQRINRMTNDETMADIVDRWRAG